MIKIPPKSIQQITHILTQILFPIALGTWIYLGFRQESLLVFSWIRIIGIENEIAAMRVVCQHISLHELIKNSLPDGLWVYSGTQTMQLIWGRMHDVKSSIWISSPFILALGMEFGQFAGIVPGHYSNYDVVFILLFFATPMTLNQWRKHENKN